MGAGARLIIASWALLAAGWGFMAVGMPGTAIPIFATGTLFSLPSALSACRRLLGER